MSNADTAMDAHHGQVQVEQSSAVTEDALEHHPSASTSYPPKARPKSMEAIPTESEAPTSTDIDVEAAQSPANNEDDTPSRTNDVPSSPPPGNTDDGIITPAMRTRVSLGRRLWTGFSALRGRSRFFLLFNGLSTFAQIATLTTTLSLSAARHQTCSKPIQTYLAVYIVRIAIIFPIQVYNALAPPSRPPRGVSDTPEWRESRELRRIIGSPVLDTRLKSLSDLLGVFAVVWFVVGNVWTWNALECKETSPYLFWSSIATLVIAYLRIAEIVAILFAVIFFLPAVIIFLRMTGGLEKKHEIGPLSKDEIAKIPVVYYIPAPAEEPSTTNASVDGEISPQEKKPASRPATPAVTTIIPSTQKDQSPSSTPSRRHGKLQRLFLRRKQAKVSNFGAHVGSSAKGHDDAGYVKTAYPLHPLPDNLSSCPICLSDYEAPPLRTASPEEQAKGLEDLEPLNLLPCKHAIHKDCLAPWLQTSGRCPVCQQAIVPENPKDTKRRARASSRANVQTPLTTRTEPQPTPLAPASAPASAPISAPASASSALPVITVAAV